MSNQFINLSYKYTMRLTMRGAIKSLDNTKCNGGFSQWYQPITITTIVMRIIIVTVIVSAHTFLIRACCLGKCIIDKVA